MYCFNISVLLWLLHPLSLCSLMFWSFACPREDSGAISSACGHRVGATESFIHSWDPSSSTWHGEDMITVFLEATKSVCDRKSPFPGMSGKRNVPFSVTLDVSLSKALNPEPLLLNIKWIQLQWQKTAFLCRTGTRIKVETDNFSTFLRFQILIILAIERGGRRIFKLNCCNFTWS